MKIVKNYDRYIEFYLENSNNFPREFDFSFSRVFNNLISLNPLKFEIEIIDLFQTKIRDGYRIYEALNILAFIGISKSINFLSQFLEDTDDILRQKSSYCIRKIKERSHAYPSQFLLKGQNFYEIEKIDFYDYNENKIIKNHEDAIKILNSISFEDSKIILSQLMALSAEFYHRISKKL